MSLNRVSLNTVFLAISLSFFLIVPGGSEAAAPDPDAQQRQFSELYVNGMLQGNSGLFEHWFSSEIKVMPEYDQSFLGRDATKQYYASIFERYLVSQYARSPIDVIDLGQRRLVIGEFDISIRSKVSGQITSVTGTYFDIWDTSSDDHRLLTLAWNFNEKVDGVESAFRAKNAEGIHYAFQPTVAATDPVSAEIAEGRIYGAEIMLRLQPAMLSYKYHADAWYSPHDRPIVKGRDEINEFQLEYAKNWPTFDYVDVNAHELYVHEDFVLEHMSYNLRWRTREDYSGITIGKGIRLSKRDATGRLKSYRSIAMHD